MSTTAKLLHEIRGDEFTLQYLSTALWSSTDLEPLDKKYGVEDFTPEALAQMIAEAQAFETAHAELIGDRERDAGHDFWLTRNGHGAGFWDGDWPEPAATKLTDASKKTGTRDLFVGDDGRLYVYPAKGGNLEGVSDFRVGQRVQLHPATDAWMRGDRYGDVVKVGREKIHVKMDRSGRTLPVAPRNLLPAD